MLDAQVPPKWPSNLLNRSTYYVLQLGDPKPKPKPNPKDGIISDDSDEEEPDGGASAGSEGDSDAEVEDVDGYVPAPGRADGAVILPEDAAEHAIDVITNR